MTAATQQATPTFGLDIDFQSFGSDLHMPGIGLFSEFIDTLASGPQSAAPAAPKVSPKIDIGDTLDNKPTFANPVPAMRL